MIYNILIFVSVYVGMLTLVKLLGKEPLSNKTPVKGHGLKKKFVSVVSGMVRLKPGRRKELERKLLKTGYVITAEEFVAEGYFKAFLFVLLSIFLLINGNLYLCIYMLLVATLLYRNHLRKLTKKAKEIDLLIIADIPEFFSYVTSGLKSNKDIISIVKTYLQAANPALKSELERLLADLKTGNIDAALLDFDMRLNLPQLSSFISAVRATLDGELQTTTLEMLTVDMEFYENETAAKLSSEIPGKISRASFAVAVATILFFIVLMLYTLLIGINKLS